MRGKLNNRQPQPDPFGPFPSVSLVHSAKEVLDDIGDFLRR